MATLLCQKFLTALGAEIQPLYCESVHMSTTLSVSSADLPGLHQSASEASRAAQRYYFSGLFCYLLVLMSAALVAFLIPDSGAGTLLSALLFLASMGILIGMRVHRPDDVWYNGRAVAESVKTRAWRWMMKAEPYLDTGAIDAVCKQFISDLKAILAQNRNLAQKFTPDAHLAAPITERMKAVRALLVAERLAVYMNDRVDDQARWYGKKSVFNRKRAQFWFWVSVVLHSLAIAALLCRVRIPTLSVPTEVLAAAASAVLTWLQAKKHNELASSYSLAAHEIALIKGEGISVTTEAELSDFVVNTEAAFSREHTQWAARRND